MIIGKPKDQNVTRVGQPFFAPLPEPQIPEPETVSELDGLIGLRRTCGQLEAGIGQLAEDIARNGAQGADGRVLGMFKAFAADTQTLLDGMQPGAARARVAAAAKRDGKALMNEAASSLERARHRNAATQIAGVAQGLAGRVAADPARLGSARQTIAELTGAADLPVVEADAVMRQSFAAMEAAVAPEVRATEARTAAVPSPLPGSSLPSPPRGLAQPPAQVVFPSGQKTGQSFTDAARRVPPTEPDRVEPGRDNEDQVQLSAPADAVPSAVERRPGLAERRQRAPNAGTELPAQRNSVLEAEGFAFVRRPEGGFWIDAEGARARPEELRTRVASRLETRANKEHWSSSRFLQELSDARQGLPRSDQRNIETAFVLAPFVPFMVEGASAAVSATVNALLAGAGVAAYFGIRDSELLDGIEQADEETDKDGNGNGPDDSGNTPVLPLPPRAPRHPKRDPSKEKVFVYRVEGETWPRILIDEKGSVNIPLDRDRMLHLNFGDFDRAMDWLVKKFDRPESVNPTIKQFTVSKKFLDRVRAAAIEQDEVKIIDTERLRPQIDDPTKADDQFGLPPLWIKRLWNAMDEDDKKSGVVLTPDDVGLGSRGR